MASLADFSATVTADPNFSAAWDSIYAQLQKEGGDVSKVNSAKIAFTESFQQLSSQGFGLSGTSAIDAAKAYVMAGQTVVGAIGTVSSLVNTFNSGTPVQVVQAFTGTMIGAAIAAGALSAGVGAAVVGGVSVVLQMLQSVGLFGTPPPTTKICGDVTLTWAPTFVVGCVAFDTMPGGVAQVAPGSTLWRPFPSESDPQDSGWYAQTKRWLAVWRGIGVTAAKDNVQSTFRPIDRAFPNFARVRGDSLTDVAATILKALGAPAPAAAIDPHLADFYKAFFAAWKSNAEYALNGLKPQPDETVLVHAVRMWNRAHQGPSVTLSGPSYAASLAQSALAQVRSDDPIVSGGQIVVNVGPLATTSAVVAEAARPVVRLTLPPRVVHLTLAGAARTPAAPATLDAVYAAAAKKRPSYWPYLPAAVGAAAVPWLGIAPAIVGGFASLVWRGVTR